MWTAVKRIYREAADERMVGEHNERIELAWDEDENDMKKPKAAKQRMNATRASMRSWEAAHRVAMAGKS